MSTEPAAAVEVRRDALVLAALCVASFLAALNFYAATPFYSRISRDLDTTVPLVGQVATLMILVSACLGLAVGPLADRYGFRWPLVIGMFAIAVNLLGTGLAPSYPVLLVVGLAGGLGDALVFSLPLAIAGVRFAGQEQRRAMGWIIGALSVAPILGAPILTTIGGIAGWRTAMVSAGVGTVVAAWFVASVLPADDRRPATRFQWRELRSSYAPLLGHWPTVRVYGASALRAVTWIGLLTYLGAFLGDEIGLSTRQTGLVYTVSGVGYAIGSVIAGGKVHLGPPRLVVAGTCAVAGLMVGVLLILANAWVVVVLLIVASLGSAISGVGIATLLAAESPVGSGTTMVLNGSVLNLGAAAGTALGGGLIALGGYEALGVGLPVFSVIAAVLAWWPVRRR